MSQKTALRPLHLILQCRPPVLTLFPSGTALARFRELPGAFLQVGGLQTTPGPRRVRARVCEMVLELGTVLFVKSTP